MYKIGLAGYGGFGEFLHANWEQLNDIHVSAACDIRSDLDVKGVAMFHNFDEFLDSDMDIVSIVTPPSTHVDLALRAIRAGKHVLIEKPMAMTVKDVNLLIAESNKLGVQISTNYMLRFNPLVRLVKELVNGHYAGNLIHVAVSNIAQDESLPAKHWFWNRQVSGGIFTEHAVHFFDLVYYVSGQTAIGVEGFSSWRDKAREDRVMGAVKHSAGLLASHYHAFCRPGLLEKTTIKFVFELGELELTGWIPLTGRYEGVCDRGLKDLLLKCDNMKIEREIPLSDLKDESRPDGWGSVAEGYEILKVNNANSFCEISFGVNRSKTEIYGDCVRESLLSLVQQIEEPSMQSLDVSSLLEAISIAERLVKSADSAG